MELRLVIDAVEAKSAGKVNERLLLVELAEHLCRGLERGELTIGVEDVEFAVILPEGCAGVGAAGVVDGFGRALAFADNHGVKNAEQTVAIGTEILQYVDGAALVAKDGDKIDRGHLRADELLGRGESAKLITGRHRRHVEIESKQAAILVALIARVSGFICERASSL